MHVEMCLQLTAAVPVLSELLTAKASKLYLASPEQSFPTILQGSVPYLDPTLLATDSTGLEILQKAGSFACHPTWDEAKTFGGMAASAAILEAGYSLGCIHASGQGIESQDRNYWSCGEHGRPHMGDMGEV